MEEQVSSTYWSSIRDNLQVNSAGTTAQQKGHETNRYTQSPAAVRNHKHGHHSNRSTCKTMIPNEIRHTYCLFNLLLQTFF
jgi:protein-tyrosine-phosphatase